MEWFENTFRTYYREVHRFVYVLCPNKNVVEDIVQDIFLVLYRKRVKLTDHPCIVGWLFTTARNKVMDYAKISNRKRKYEIQQFSSEALQKVYHIDFIPFEVYGALNNLLNDKEIKLLKNLEYGFTVKELTEQTGGKRETVRKQVWRLKRKIKKILYMSIIVYIIVIVQKGGIK